MKSLFCNQTGRTRNPGSAHLPDLDEGVEFLGTKVGNTPEATCQSSHIAARHLARLGYTRVAVFGGGKNASRGGGIGPRVCA